MLLEKMVSESSARGERPAGSEDSMRRGLMKPRGDDLRAEYDLARLKGGVRGKYYQRATAGTNLVLLEPDVAHAFPDSSCVNRALRLLQGVAAKSRDMALPGLNLHSLGGDRKGTWAVSVSGNWRITFSFVGKAADAVD
jgi:plasmid maintenance system killer protein